MRINGVQQRRDRRGGKKRKLKGHKVRFAKWAWRVEVLDQLAAMSGPLPLVGMCETLIEREFERRLKRMGFIPPIDDSSC